MKDHLSALVAAVLMGAGSASVWTYGRSLLVETGGGSERSTVAAWIVLGIGATAVIATARTLSTWAPAKAWVWSCAPMTLAIVALAVAPQHAVVAMSACLVFGWGFTAGTSALIAWTSDIDVARSAAGTAMLFVALVLGQAIGATAIGSTIAVAGYTAAFITAAALSAAAVATGAFRLGATRDEPDPITDDAAAPPRGRAGSSCL